MECLYVLFSWDSYLPVECVWDVMKRIHTMAYLAKK